MIQSLVKEMESETAVRMRQLELQKSEADASISGRRPPSDPDNVFDVRKNVAMVPIFQETEIESYFGAFERIALLCIGQRMCGLYSCSVN